MDSSQCAECRAIYQALQDAYRAAIRDGGQREHAEELSGWVQQLDRDECARIRESSEIWEAWRRLQRHRTLTGHTLPVVSIPAGALSNPN